MQTTFEKYCLIASVTASLMFLGSSAKAQAILSLTPSVATVNSGDTVTFALNLTGGTNLVGYTTSVSANNAYLSFVGANPFTSTFTGFETEITNAVNGFKETTGALDINYATLGAAINNPGTTQLGTFQIMVNSTLPSGDTPITLMASSGPTSFDPSSVTNLSTGANELTTVTNATLLPAPEPSAALALLLGAAALGVMLRARKRRSVA